MLSFPTPDPLNGETLLEELAAAAVTVTGLPQVVDGKLVLDVSDADAATVEQVLAAHAGDPSPRAVNGPIVRQALRDHMADLRTIIDSSGTLSNLQLSNAVRALARGQRRLIRYVLGDLDGTD